LLLLGIVLLALLPATYWTRLSALTDPGKDWTLTRRISYHVVALDLVQTHPFLGVGPANFRDRYVGSEYRWIPGRTLTPRDLHNLYLGVLVESGIIGFVFFVGFLGAVLIGLRETARHAEDSELRLLAEAVHFATVGYLIACATVPALTSKYLWVLAGTGAAVSGAAEVRAEPAVPSSLVGPMPEVAGPVGGA
jgi:O-antigen ligase